MKSNIGSLFEVVSIPAIKTANSDCKEDNRSVGKALWHNRDSLSYLLQLKNEDLALFETFYQQQPMSQIDLERLDELKQKMKL